MHEDVPLPNRRSVRLHSFDYSGSGAYFVTVCAHDRKCIFGEIIFGKPALFALGQLVDRCRTEIPLHFAGAELLIHVVMPNHLHGMIVLNSRVRAAHQRAAALRKGEAFAAPVASSIPTIIRAFKSAVTKSAREIAGRPDLRVWRRGYYEHVVRDKRDFQNTWDYIRWNPERWDCDEENPHGKSGLRTALP